MSSSTPETTGTISYYSNPSAMEPTAFVINRFLLHRCELSVHGRERMALIKAYETRQQTLYPQQRALQTARAGARADS